MNISDSNLVTVKGPKGELTQQIDPDLGMNLEDGVVKLSRPTEQKRHKALHGLYRSLLANMVEGVTKGFVKELELIGVGYRVANSGNLLELTVGYSHPIMFYIPDEIKLETVMEKGKPPSIRMECTDKQLLGERGEMLVVKHCACPKCKRTRSLKRLPPNFKCADVVCDFCGYLAQVKAKSCTDVDQLPKVVLGASWGPVRLGPGCR